jgi:hypothetical protein
VVRGTLILSALAVMLAAIPAAAHAAVTVTMTGPEGPIPKGNTAEYTATVVNRSGFSEPGVSLVVGSYRAEGDRPVPNPYRAFSSTKGSCAREDFPSKFGTYYSLNCALGTLTPGATVRVTASVEINESMSQYADVEPGYGRDELITYVSAPPVIEGSSKIKVKGLPEGCASRPFTLKVKAKGAKKITGKIVGPRSADGKPVSFYDSDTEKLDTVKGSKLKQRIEVDGLVPDYYYETSLAAKYKHGPKQKSTVLFQVCA